MQIIGYIQFKSTKSPHKYIRAVQKANVKGIALPKLTLKIETVK